MTVDGQEVFATEGYEYGVQHFSPHENKWRMTWTNHFDGWYPSEKSAKNALAQLRAPAWGYPPQTEYRLVRRPVGEIEVIDEEA